MKDKPISDLRRRMLEDMAVRRLGEKTQHDYIKHVETFTRFLGRAGRLDERLGLCAEDIDWRHVSTACGLASPKFLAR